MIEPRLNYQSVRAKKARLTIALSGIWQIVFLILEIGLLLGGIALLANDRPIGWLILSLSSVPFMVRQWWRYDLYRLEILDNPKTVDGVMSSSVLGRLPDSPSPYDVATIIGTTSSGIFIGLRFGTGVKFFQEIASKNSGDMEQIWRLAIELQQQTDSKTISGGVLALALIKNFPDYDNILAHLRLDYEDLKQGVRWHDYLHLKKKQTNQYIKTGGIARDWSFGYTPLLKQFGVNISEVMSNRWSMSTKIPSHSKMIDHMIETFSSGGRQNIALIGPYGTGKTTLVHNFAQKIFDANQDIPANLRFRQVIMLDASSLISAASKKGQIEALMNKLLSEAYASKNTIICLDNAELFFQEGVGSVNITNLLAPVLEAGGLRMILIMDEQQFLKISQTNPGLASALNKIMVAPTNEADTMLILQDKVISLERNLNVIYMYQSLKEAYYLSQRYIYDIAMPGQAIKLLESAASYHQKGLVRFVSVQEALEKSMNVKVASVSNDQEKSKLLSLEQLIHERMVNQVDAVRVVSDALRRARAGVRNQNRPIGTFLFLGPTGVGKTELAKALSEVYFNGETNLIRLDLNEFVTVNDVSRLIESAAQNQYSLTAQVMRQPFSVVLLDEIEKASGAVLETLLQVLDEGILRDQDNKEVSFRDAIIIATSNAGALDIQKYISDGVAIKDFELEFLDKLINSQQFKPEFLNRFDEIVIFKPLEKVELLQIIDLILKGLNKTLSSQKIQVRVSQDGKKFLVEKGYDPRLGARPMRRIVQKTVENIVAKQIIADQISSERIVDISLEDLVEALKS